jgi:predicted transcriptional regulator of viral defense system
MSAMSRNVAINELFKKSVFTAKDANTLGISSSQLAYYVKLGTIDRVARGVYRNPAINSSAPFEWQDLLEIAYSIPQGTICLISALSYYGLTQEIQRQFWIAVPHETKDIKRPKTKIIRMRNAKLGRVPLKLGDFDTYIFDKERSIIDAFRFLSKESAVYSLKVYLKRTDDHKSNLSKLARYAKELRVDILPYLEALT